jgi:hypothetical protein
LFFPHYTRAKADVMDGCAWQPLAKLLEQPPFVIVGEFLQKDCIPHHHFEDTTPQRADTRLPGVCLADGIKPRLFMLQALLFPTPPARGEQSAEDLTEEFWAFFHVVLGTRPFCLAVLLSTKRLSEKGSDPLNFVTWTNDLRHGTKGSDPFSDSL